MWINVIVVVKERVKFIEEIKFPDLNGMLSLKVWEVVFSMGMFNCGCSFYFFDESLSSNLSIVSVWQYSTFYYTH